MDSNLKFKLKEGALKAQIDYLKSPNKGCNARDLKSRFEALLNEKNNLNNEIDRLNKDFANLNVEYNKLLNSKWWKLTKPGRKLFNFFKKSESKHETVSNRNAQKTCFDNLFPGKNININDFMDFETAKRQTEIKFDKNEKISIVVPLFNTKINYLKEMIDSTRNQTYKNFELILSDASDKNHEYIKNYCEEIIKLDSRIKYIKLEKNGGISNNTNEAIKIATGSYIGFLGHDDILHPACLFECMLAINNHNADFIYTDHLIFQNDNLRDNPFIYYKPDFSPDTLRSLNCIGHFNLIKKSLLDKVGLLKSEFDGAQDYDIAFRATEKAKSIIHIPKLLYYFRACDTSSAINPQSKPYMHNVDIKALQEHIDRLGLKGTAVKLSESNGLHNVNYEIKGNPLISIIIPNKDHAYDLFRCINSIEEKSSYKNYEIIIVENNSSDPLIFEYYKELEKQENINIIEYKGEFNYSAINNFAVNHAKGDYLLFLNNDIEIINDDWIERLLMFAQRKDIGCVGAKLFYPNDKIQHGGGSSWL